MHAPSSAHAKVLPFTAPTHFYAFRDEIVEVILHEPDGPSRDVPEALVQDLWHTGRFHPSALTTSGGKPIEVISPGDPNPDSGPDFVNARLRIGAMTWAGDVEIHVASGNWFEHRHHLDPRYNGVILHVALFSDLWTGGLLREDGTVLPEITLFPHLEAPLRRLLHRFLTRAPETLPCEAEWPRTSDAVLRPWIERLGKERVEAGRRSLEARYLANPDLESLLHERLFAGLGYSKNDGPMADLTRRLPLASMRSLTDPCDLEAIHLGTAGLLPAPGELRNTDRDTAEYVMHLRARYDALRIRFDAPEMERTRWRFFRLRPANFPPLRIAQGVSMLHTLLRHDPLGILLEAVSRQDPVSALRDVIRSRPLPFWDRHYRLTKATRPRDPSPGPSRVDALIINAVLPVLYLIAEQQSDLSLEARILEVMSMLPAEKDLVTRRFEALGFRPRNALHTQGIHQLSRTRCEAGRCLSCPIGLSLVGDG